MSKTTKKNTQKQLKSVFLELFDKKELTSKSKNILILALSSEKEKERIIGVRKLKRFRETLELAEKNAVLNGKSLFTRLSYSKGWVNFELSEYAKILKLEKNQYIDVPFDDFSSLKSKHAKSLYLKLLKFKKTGVFYANRISLFNIFGCKKWREVRQKYLVPALDEIQKKIKFDYFAYSLEKSLLTVEYSLPFKSEEQEEKNEIVLEGEKKIRALSFLRKEFSTTEASLLRTAVNTLSDESLISSVNRYYKLSAQKERREREGIEPRPGEVNNPTGLFISDLRKKISEVVEKKQAA